MEIAKDFRVENVHVRAIALLGEARDALEEKINSLMPNMVVISSRGVGAVKRLFMGSTSQHLVHHLKVPVVVLPPPSS